MSKRLTLEETKNCLIAWREQGNEEALVSIFDSCFRLVYFFAQKYVNKGLSLDDLCSAGKEGLLKGINKFDYMNRPIEGFTSYISIAIDNQIKMELRGYRKHSHVLSFEQNISQKSDGGELKIEEIIGTDSEQLMEDAINGMRKDTIRDILQSLTPKERQVILLRYGFDDNDKKTLEEVASILGCSRTLVSNYEQKALTKMRRPKTVKKIKDFIEN